MNSPIKPNYNFTSDELKSLVEAAAEAGAKKALADIGLHDDDAGDDVKELRGLLESWRVAKQEAWKTAVGMVTKGALICLMLGAWYKFGTPIK